MKNEKYTYLTVASDSVGEVYKEKGSKFIGYAFSVETEEEIKNHINQVKIIHAKARHWCYAWQLGVDIITYRTNDNGEPNNSAGKPIYGQILAANITNVLIIVVRYYGGTKLGVGGLIFAYKKGASNALKIAKITKKTVKKYISLTFEYKDLNTVMKMIKKFDVKVIEKQMDLNCYYKLVIRKSYFSDFKKQVSNYDNSILMKI
ncbi:MAG: IMPACT family protein [Flavobacteriaceae bacterium]|nr:IMPACT family protein [Flavobacteriaceae bacterium]